MFNILLRCKLRKTNHFQATKSDYYFLMSNNSNFFKAESWFLLHSITLIAIFQKIYITHKGVPLNISKLMAALACYQARICWGRHFEVLERKGGGEILKKVKITKLVGTILYCDINPSPPIMNLLRRDLIRILGKDVDA